MKLSNLNRATEIHQMLTAYRAARKALSDEEKIVLNGVELPHEISYRIIQLLNVEINLLESEVEKL